MYITVLETFPNFWKEGIDYFLFGLLKYFGPFSEYLESREKKEKEKDPIPSYASLFIQVFLLFKEVLSPLLKLEQYEIHVTTGFFIFYFF